MSLVSFNVITVIFIICHGVDFIKKFNSLQILPFQMYLRMGCSVTSKFLRKHGLVEKLVVISPVKDNME